MSTTSDTLGPVAPVGPAYKESLAALGVHEAVRLDGRRSLKDELLQARGVDVDQCLECGKCSGGCSTGHIFDYTPRKIVQLVKLGNLDMLLHMDALSVCVGCGLCRDRCPVGIDAAALIDHFRQKAHRQGIALSRDKVALFNELFLEGIRSRGRTAELPLMLQFNIRTSQYLKDAGLGRRLLFKRKLRVFGSRVKQRAVLRRLFEPAPDASLPRPVSGHAVPGDGVKPTGPEQPAEAEEGAQA